MSISIALCTYNGAKYIKEQLESLINQTMMPDEIVVGDDASNDDTIEIVKSVLEKWGGNYRVLYNEKNLGYLKNFEKTIGACSGEYIFLCDQDDVWRLDKIQRVMQIFQMYPDTGMVFHDAEIVDNDLHCVGERFWKQLSFYDLQKPEKYIIYDNGNVVQGCASAIKREVFECAYPFPEKIYHDKWLATTALLTSRLRPLDEPLLLYRQHENNVMGAFTDSTSLSNSHHYGLLERQKRLAKNNVEFLDERISIYTGYVDRFEKNNEVPIMKELKNELCGLKHRKQYITNRNVFSLLKLYWMKTLNYYEMRDFRRDLRSVLWG